MTKYLERKLTKLRAERDAAQAVIESIEQGVRGTLYNPSDCDLAIQCVGGGRVCVGDIERDKGTAEMLRWTDAYNTWHRLSGVIAKTITRARRAEARKPLN